MQTKRDEPNSSIESATPNKRHKPNSTTDSATPTVQASSSSLGENLMGAGINYLNAQDAFHVGLTAQRYLIFRQSEQIRQLMNLVEEYQVNNSKSKKHDSYFQGIVQQSIFLKIDGQPKIIKNPILLLIHALLIKNPELLTITIFHLPTFRNSVVKNICRLSNFMLKELVSQLIPGGAKAIADTMAEIFEAENKYSLILRTVTEPGRSITETILPSLVTAPTLIRHYDENSNVVLTLWGLMNGKMQLTTLTHQIVLMAQTQFSLYNLPPIQNGAVLLYEGDHQDYDTAITLQNYRVYFVNEGLWLTDVNNSLVTCKLENASPEHIKTGQYELLRRLYTSVDLTYPAEAFIYLPFPTDTNVTHVIGSDQITLIQYDFLRQGHSEIYDLREYTRAMTAFYQKYPAHYEIAPNFVDQVENDWYEMIGKTLAYMPAWLAQVWCSETPFAPKPNFNDVILQTQITGLFLEGNFSERSAEDFFYTPDKGGAISKGSEKFALRSDAIHDPIELASKDKGIEGNDDTSADSHSEDEELSDGEEPFMLEEQNLLDLWAMLDMVKLMNQSYEKSKLLYLAEKNAIALRPIRQV
jgi:hypothetical protein